MISYDDFAKVEIKVGKILSAEKIPDTDKLLKLSVDFGLKPVLINTDTTVPPIVGGGDTGVVSDISVPELPKLENDIRQIVSGISTYFPDPAILVGKKCMFVTNLEPRKIRGYDSNGMLFAVSSPDGAFSLLEPIDAIPVGTKAK